ncbi:MAG TPA: polysaccharide biosynthesis/export family protein [Hyphomicrobiaceae bacterium]|nr:polysaccharide biosynthesis/export family protein [Hyphomicrobiaceae bacterium]
MILRSRRVAASRAHRVLLVVPLLLALAFPGLLSSDAVAGAPRLAPGDRVTVTVFGQADLTGAYQVDGDGNLDLPLVGAIAVARLTTKECEQLISTQLANGYLRNPVVSVRLTEPRPLYVLGDVKAAGAFPFRYGSTVLSAVALAGGYATTDMPQSVAAAEFLIAEERVQTLEASRRILLIRKARLEAQRDGKATFAAPAFPSSELTEKIKAVIAATVASETEALGTQAAALASDLELLRSQKPRLEEAAAAVEKQIVAEKTQFDLVQGQLNDVARLQSLGLARRTTEVTLQREQAALDSNISRYRSELARLAVAVGEFDIKVQDTQHAYDRRVAAELQDVRTKLLEIETTLPSARDLRELRAQQAAGTALPAGSDAPRVLVVTRAVDGKVKSMNVTEDTLLEPGDVVEVRRVRERERASSLPKPGAQAEAAPAAVTVSR